ncbi:MAG: toll/interleukin-1 receptor domain-containing protein [Cyanobacteria bacterium P01_E01_bin.6]
MANEEYLKILRQGADTWNAYREINEVRSPDFEHVVLKDIDLTKANLSGANFMYADLRRSNFQRALLEVASFYGADLTGTCLKGAELNGAYLQRALLTEADFNGASLYGAMLHEANLSSANLKGAVLQGAELQDANLSSANIEGANIKGALLNRVDLRQANLRGAIVCGTALDGAIFEESNIEATQFRDVRLRETVFSNVDLSKADGLDLCIHTGPSCVDYRTLMKSKNVPISFWRGCGLSDWQIEAAKLSQPGLTQDDVISISYEVARLRGEQPIQLFSPFISYSSKDEDFAKSLYDDLQSNGVRCWYAPEDMKIGDRIRRRIDEVIHLHDKLLLILSEHSVASEWVEDEVETAFEKERKTGETVLFPIKLDNTVEGIETGWAAKIRRQRHIGDFTKHDAYQASFERVLRDLRALP